MLHSDWTTPAFDLEPVAPATGPFTRRPFLETWWRHRRLPDDVLVLADVGDGLAPCVVREGCLQFAGEADLTDYHAPLGRDASAAVVAAITGSGATSFHFDSLPEEAAVVVAKALVDIGCDAQPERHETAAVLRLPATFDAWLDALSRKDRHELRRKRRRFTSDLGEPELVRDRSTGAVASFAAMHRAARGDKGDFMDDAMEAFFSGLVDAGFVVDLLVAGGRPVAAAFGFEDDDGYYLYNSAYEPEAAASSPGVVLLGELIASQIDRGAFLLDLMKGDEGYKFRLGAEPRPLLALAGSLS